MVNVGGFMCRVKYRERKTSVKYRGGGLYEACMERETLWGQEKTNLVMEMSTLWRRHVDGFECLDEESGTLSGGRLYSYPTYLKRMDPICKILAGSWQVFSDPILDKR